MKTFTTLAFLLFATHLVYSQKPQTPTEKVLYNIILPRGLSSAKFLSCNKSTKVDLWHKDDDETQQTEFSLHSLFSCCFGINANGQV
jgi:hypothetical protein